MAKTKSTDQYPDQWDEKRIQALINYYETQNEDEAVAEDENFFETELMQRSAKPDSMWAIVRNGKIELINHAELPEGTKLLVTLLPDPIPVLI